VPGTDSSLPNGGKTLRRAFEALVSTLNDRGDRYAIIGGLATIQHTRVRTTDDIDALVAVPQIGMAGLFEALRAKGFVVDVPRNIRELRDDGLTSVQFEGVIVDLLRPLIPAQSHVLDRAVQAELLDQRVRVSSPEGLIVLKLMAMRPQDESDIRDILIAHRAQLDLQSIRNELETFTREGDERRPKLEAWIAEAKQRD